MTVSRTRCARIAPSSRALFTLLVVPLALGGCLERELRPLVPCVSQGFIESVEANAVDKVDLLFMVDNSGSMKEEQASLAEQLPRLVRVLTSGDRTGDGLSDDDFQPVKDLHVAVITSDMGVGGQTVPPVNTCTRAPLLGDDGLLRTIGAAGADCLAAYPGFLAYVPATTTQTPEQFGIDFGCVARAGTTGCGFEQQLEAPLKALTSSTSAIRFFGDTRGHGDAGNAGFMRPDSVLAIVVVTDEEDCSVAAGSEGIFDQSAGSAFSGDLNLRCFRYPGAQWPVQRYIDGFKALRPGRENLVVFGAITGVPVDLIRQPVASSTAAITPDYDGILADPRMTQVEDIDSTVGPRLVPSCSRPNPDGTTATAFPPRRIVEVAKGFGANGIVQSICQNDFAGALNAIIAKIADALGDVCLPRKLNADEHGLVRCDVVELIPPPGSLPDQPTSCADLPGVEPTPIARPNVTDGSIACKVIQRAVVDGAPEAGDGWFYDDFSEANSTSCPGGQRIAFAEGALPPNGIRVNLECLQRIQGSGGGASAAVQLGTGCDPLSAVPEENPCAVASLVCEPNSRTCQVGCSTNADCPTSLVCDTASGAGVCRNPICVD
jgi:hypothetical protein